MWAGAAVATAVIGALATALITEDRIESLFGGNDDPGQRAEQTETSVEPDGRNCPSGFPVKGNIATSGEKIYHLPGWRYYDDTYPVSCFASPALAEDGGFRASKVQ